MIRTCLISQQSGQNVIGDMSLINDWKQDPHKIIWIDFENEDKAKERQILEEEFNLDALALDDAQRDRHPPKLEWFDKYFFLLLKAFNAETDSIDFGILHISFFVSDNFIITRHAGVSPSVNYVWNKLNSGNLDIKKGSAYICYRIVRKIIDRYTPIILSLEKRLDYLEEEMLSAPNDELLAELMNYNSKLKKLRRIFGYQETVITELATSKIIAGNESVKHEFLDAHEQMERLASLSNLFQELARDLMDGYISVTSHRLNKIMKVLTIVAVLFLPLTFIAGIYGMNFEHMPELGWKYAYFIVLAAMFFIAIMMLIIFRKLKWL